MSYFAPEQLKYDALYSFNFLTAQTQRLPGLESPHSQAPSSDPP